MPHRDRLPSEDRDIHLPPATERVAEETAPHDWIVVARFANVAEAGYFADVLAREWDVPSRLHEESHFEAINSSWTTRFHLLVPDADAERAAEALTAHVADLAEDDDALAYATAWDAGEETAAVTSAAGVGEIASATRSDGWNPLGTVLLTLAAGTIGFQAARWLEAPAGPAHRRAPQRQDDALWNALSERPLPWVQFDPQGRPVARLDVDADTGTVVLQRDADGDGVAEDVVRHRR